MEGDLQLRVCGDRTEVVEKGKIVIKYLWPSIQSVEEIWRVERVLFLTSSYHLKNEIAKNEVYSEVKKLFSLSSTYVPALLPVSMLPRYG